LNPGETSGGKPARNKTILSDDRLRKRVVIGCKNLPHAIDCQFTVFSRRRGPRRALRYRSADRLHAARVRSISSL
jgi:hypothetical protein